MQNAGIGAPTAAAGQIPSPASMANLVERLRIYLALTQQCLEWDKAPQRNTPKGRRFDVIRLMSARSNVQEELGRLLYSQTCLALVGWSGEVRDTLREIRESSLYAYHPSRYTTEERFDADRAGADLARLAELVERLAGIMRRLHSSGSDANEVTPTAESQPTPTDPADPAWQTLLSDPNDRHWKHLSALIELKDARSGATVNREKVTAKAGTGNHDSDCNEDSIRFLMKHKLITSRSRAGCTPTDLGRAVFLLHKTAKSGNNRD
jgi:hypothetical protein